MVNSDLQNTELASGMQCVRSKSHVVARMCAVRQLYQRTPFPTCMCVWLPPEALAESLQVVCVQQHRFSMCAPRVGSGSHVVERTCTRSQLRALSNMRAWSWLKRL